MIKKWFNNFLCVSFILFSCSGNSEEVILIETSNDLNDSNVNNVQVITDTDGDGVEDALDSCPNTVANSTVNTNGCSQNQLDSDFDGITNDIDICNDTPQGLNVDENGCAITEIYLDDNGVTVKAKSTAIVGETYYLNGNFYTVVDNFLLREQMRASGNDEDKDFGLLVTTFVTDMSYLFSPEYGSDIPARSGHPFSSNSFDLRGDISGWDVSNVTTMKSMFASIQADLSYWDVSNVTDMSNMFSATYVDVNISNWNVSNVTNMFRMFNGSDFNYNINEWDVSNVTNMGGMFSENAVFNQPLDNWDTSNVVWMDYMFQKAESFNQNINEWDVSSVYSIAHMFEKAYLFNQPLNNWDVSGLVDLEYFLTSAFFYQDLSDWDVSSVKNFRGIGHPSMECFDLSNWDTSSACNCVGTGNKETPEKYEYSTGCSIDLSPDFSNCFTYSTADPYNQSTTYVYYCGIQLNPGFFDE